MIKGTRFSGFENGSLVLSYMQTLKARTRGTAQGFIVPSHKYRSTVILTTSDPKNKSHMKINRFTTYNQTNSYGGYLMMFYR